MKIIEITKKVRSSILTKREIENIFEFVYKKEKIKNYLISCFFVTDKEIKSLHKKYLNKNSTTDVLTFVLKKNPLTVDLCVNIQEAKRQAKIFNVSNKNEVSRLLIHCALHSIGYDDTTEIKKKKMFEVQEKYLKLILKN